MKSLSLLIVLILGIFVVACTGGRSHNSRDGYCFNDEKTGTYDPIPLKYENDNYRKAIFSLKASEENKKAEKDIAQTQISPKFYTTSGLSVPNYGGGDLNDKILKSEEKRKLREEARRKELSKIYPLEVGTYEYVSAEVYLSEYLPQVVSQNKYLRIHVSHVKNKKGDFVFSNNCVSNLPYNDSVPPVSVQGITGFKILDNGEVLTDKLGSYTIEFKNWELKSIFNDSGKNLPLSPKEFFSKTGLEYQLYKIANPKNMEFTHELRTKGKVGKVDYYITVRLKYLSAKELAKREAERNKKIEKPKKS